MAVTRTRFSIIFLKLPLSFLISAVKRTLHKTVKYDITNLLSNLETIIFLTWTKKVDQKPQPLTHKL